MPPCIATPEQPSCPIVIIGAYDCGSEELTHADEVVEVKARRQHLHAAVAIVCQQHEAVRRYPHLAWSLDLQRPVTTTADDPQPRAISARERVHGVRAAVLIRHQEREAVAAHRHAVDP